MAHRVKFWADRRSPRQAIQALERALESERRVALDGQRRPPRIAQILWRNIE